MTDKTPTPATGSATAPITSQDLQERFGERWQIDREMLTGIWTAERRSADGRSRRFIAAREAVELAVKLEAAEAHGGMSQGQDDDRPLLPGDRVELLTVTEDYLRFALTAGDHGTVKFTDSLGTVHIKWDSGARVGIIAEARHMIRVEPAAAPPAE